MEVPKQSVVSSNISEKKSTDQTHTISTALHTLLSSATCVIMKTSIENQLCAHLPNRQIKTGLVADQIKFDKW